MPVSAYLRWYKLPLTYYLSWKDCRTCPSNVHHMLSWRQLCWGASTFTVWTWSRARWRLPVCHKGCKTEDPFCEVLCALRWLPLWRVLQRGANAFLKMRKHAWRRMRSSQFSIIFPSPVFASHWCWGICSLLTSSIHVLLSHTVLFFCILLVVSGL